MCVMAVDDPHFRLRIPEALKKRVTEAATKNHRSINAEIVSRLESTFVIDEVLSPPKRLKSHPSEADFAAQTQFVLERIVELENKLSGAIDTIDKKTEPSKD